MIEKIWGRSIIFEGKTRKKDAEEYAKYLRKHGGVSGERCLTKIEHKAKQSIVWRRYEK